MVKIHFFGKFKEKFGDKIEINIKEEIELNELLLTLSEKYLKENIVEEINEKTAFVAINHEMINNFNIKIKNEDIIAIFPVTSGG